MAPFLRIAFNSYELGSLQAADEASQPFCAVKMKEALSTGRAGGWTLRGSSQWSWESGPGGRQRRGPALSPRTSEGPFLPHPRLPAQPSYGGRTAEATSACGASSTGCMEPSLGLEALAPPPPTASTCPCARPCAGRRGHHSAPGMAWPCPRGAFRQVGEPDDESCEREAESRHTPRLESGTWSWERRPFLLASAFIW